MFAGNIPHAACQQRQTAIVNNKFFWLIVVDCLLTTGMSLQGVDFNAFPKLALVSNDMSDF